MQAASAGHDGGPILAGMYPSLTGKRAVVLGGSRGIGRAIALRLAAEGAHVLVNYARSPEAAEATAEDCRAAGVESEAVLANIGDAAALAALFERVEQWGGLDILVNNAARGLERPRPAIEQRPKHLHSTMDVNLFGPWQASQAAVPMMEARGGGTIVNLLSPGSWNYMPDYSAVAVSKAALASLTTYLAVELAPREIRVNAVSAGWVEGSEGEHSYRREVSDRVRPHVPGGRNVSPDDVAAAVAWVCSAEAPMLIGQTLHLDGGFGGGAWGAILDPPEQG
ncbi:MAG: SDR family oxidoreductase [Dehalococcoidia bacterium]|nr:SDR family oxidoreductase [Dehalococcoidia bacterium]